MPSRSESLVGGKLPRHLPVARAGLGQALHERGQNRVVDTGPVVVVAVGVDQGVGRHRQPFAIGEGYDVQVVAHLVPQYDEIRLDAEDVGVCGDTQPSRVRDVDLRHLERPLSPQLPFLP
jgi:hypothetical protein